MSATQPRRRPTYEKDVHARALDRPDCHDVGAAFQRNASVDRQYPAEEPEGRAGSDRCSCSSLVERIPIHRPRLAFSGPRERRPHAIAEVVASSIGRDTLLTDPLRSRGGGALVRR